MVTCLRECESPFGEEQVIQFPDGTSPDERTAILAGMMLIEFTIMEERRQQNNNNNGGGGGGAPPSQEMQR